MAAEFKDIRLGDRFIRVATAGFSKRATTTGLLGTVDYMNKKQQVFVSAAVLLITTILGCSYQSAPGLKGQWKSVNRFAETTEAIPIHPPQVFYPTPVDATLKALLARWAKDTDMTLSYRHPNDFTLYGPVADIRTSDLQAALAALNTAYAGQGISIAIEQRTIVVERRPSPEVGEAIQ